MKKYLYFVAALGGFLFGFDTAVISGAERSIQMIWKLSDIQHGLTVSIALFGPTFLFFSVMMVFQLLFVWKIMPETKGRTLEEIEQSWLKPEKLKKA